MNAGEPPAVSIRIAALREGTDRYLSGNLQLQPLPVISHFNRGSSFSVAIRNDSSNVVYLVSDACSWGYRALTFELENAAGESWRAARKARGWTRNSFRVIELPPGGIHVIPVFFALTDADWPDANDPVAAPVSGILDPRTLGAWEGFPLPVGTPRTDGGNSPNGDDGASAGFRIRAVFEIDLASEYEDIPAERRPGLLQMPGLWQVRACSEWIEVEFAGIGTYWRQRIEQQKE